MQPALGLITTLYKCRQSTGLILWRTWWALCPVLRRTTEITQQSVAAQCLTRQQLRQQRHKHVQGRLKTHFAVADSTSRNCQLCEKDYSAFRCPTLW